MSDEIGLAAGSERERPLAAESPRLVPLRVGEATVYLEASTAASIEYSDQVKPVSFDPREAFDKAADALGECVRVVGERLTKFKEAAKPTAVELEFTMSFEVEGKATIVPVLVSGKSKATSGIKVTAKWELDT